MMTIGDLVRDRYGDGIVGLVIALRELEVLVLHAAIQKWYRRDAFGVVA
jgi:hypothetical protein